ncbi:hypothetical protein BO71DRAFT_429366 [Aspergillus ellipticus CBS 707.79]|uniref:Uncharacterized protein n=1 Tax=Aspergillus ellipticus CBS 707.79 TaxID=1448320 RepID=A0A319DD44_9EURO|nr:hypothetical protein BO71DRAFT_429366 [Aspergillus ellipticus CBS 707.79]
MHRSLVYRLRFPSSTAVWHAVPWTTSPLHSASTALGNDLMLDVQLHLFRPRIAPVWMAIEAYPFYSQQRTADDDPNDRRASTQYATPWGTVDTLENLGATGL